MESESLFGIDRSVGFWHCSAGAEFSAGSRLERNSLMEENHRIQDETSISEITIAPDGRIFLFGLSRPLLEMCAELNFTSPDLPQRIARLQIDGEPADHRQSPST
jgi:hypothetical protein